MRIGITTTTIEGKKKIDGIGVYTKNLVENLNKISSNIITCCYSPQNITNQPTSSLSLGKSYPLSTFLSLITPISLHQHLRRKIDILHVTDHRIPKIKNLPIIATIHDALLLQKPEWHALYLKKIKKWARKKSLAWASHFIAVSYSMVSEIVNSTDITEEEISVVYNGISPIWHLPIPRDKKDTILKKFNIKKKFLLFNGTLQKKKNLPLLIKSYLNLPNDIQDEFFLIIVGRESFGAEESLSAIFELEKKSKGKWLGYVTDEELRCLYQSASLHVHPSLHEGFGLTILEAFASGTPVLTSNIPAIREISDNAALLIDPNSQAELTNNLAKLLTNRPLMQALIERGYERVKMFSWDKCAQATFKVYTRYL